MGAAPVVEQGGIAAVAVVDVAGEFEVERAGGEVFEGRVDDVEANLLGSGGPAEGGDLGLVGGVVILVLGAAFVDAGGEAAGFLHVQVVAGVPVLAGGHHGVALVVDGEPVEDLAGELEAEARLADGAGGVGVLVGVDGVGVEAVGSALEGVTDLEVGDEASALAGGSGVRAEDGDAVGVAFDGDFGACAPLLVAGSMVILFSRRGARSGDCSQ